MPWDKEKDLALKYAEISEEAVNKKKKKKSKQNRKSDHKHEYIDCWFYNDIDKAYLPGTCCKHCKKINNITYYFSENNVFKSAEVTSPTNDNPVYMVIDFWKDKYCYQEKL